MVKAEPWSSSSLSPASLDPAAAALSHAGSGIWPADPTATTPTHIYPAASEADSSAAPHDVTGDDVTLLSMLRKVGVTVLNSRPERDDSGEGGGSIDGEALLAGMYNTEAAGIVGHYVNATASFGSSAETRTMLNAATTLADAAGANKVGVTGHNLKDYAEAAWALLENVTTADSAATTTARTSTTSSNLSSTTPFPFVNISLEPWTENSTNSSALYELGHPVIGVMLALFSLVVIVGNVMVIVAVFRELYLRSVTNYFIVSLAIADVMVGGVVMPFAISHEMTNEVWLYGQEWCDLWHSLDVLASTASILNLCVISLDRYWAITDPINYPSKMSNCKVCLLITLVWLCSAGISFPAIAWWKDVMPDDMPENQCRFTEDAGYLIVSSLISFYIPTVIMMFVYAKIYRAAMAQSEGIKAGSKITSNGLRGDDGEVMTLRIHRGGMRSQDEYHHHHHHHHHHHNHHLHSNGGSGGNRGGCSGSGCGSGGGGGDIGGGSNNNGTGGSGGSGCRGGDRDLQYERSTSDSEGESPCHSATGARMQVSDSSSGGTPRPAKHITKRLRHFAISKKLTKLAREQKAAKTLGIVVGVFIMCWLPFFVTNVLLALCKDCITNPDVLFPVVTWLGYINSGMNPIIYALSMRDFRRAFSKMIFCCCPRYRYQPPYQRPYQHHHNSLSTSSFSAACGDKCVALKI